MTKHYKIGWGAISFQGEASLTQLLEAEVTVVVKTLCEASYATIKYGRRVSFFKCRLLGTLLQCIYDFKYQEYY